MAFVGTILIGFIVGLFARFLLPGRDAAGCILTTVLGIVGAVVGGILGQALGLYREGEPAGFVMSLFGAILILFIMRKVREKR